MKINIKKTRTDAIIPTRADSGAAGYDLYSLSAAAIPPHCTVRFDTGIAMEIPEGYAGFIKDRSGMGIKGFDKHGGVIDSSYRGEIGVCLCNTTIEMKYISVGDRIAQICFQKVEDVEFEEVEELNNTTRGVGAFGSTGK